jgi:hypothetical protein
MIILELEKRCTGNRIVGSNPTLSAIFNDLGTGTKRDSRNFANLQVAITHRADPAFDYLAGTGSHHAMSHSMSHHAAPHHPGATAAPRNEELAHLAGAIFHLGSLGNAQPPCWLWLGQPWRRTLGAPRRQPRTPPFPLAKFAVKSFHALI